MRAVLTALFIFCIGVSSVFANGIYSRLGIYAIDTHSGKTFSENADQRFPLCSTSKLMIVAAVLKRSMAQKGLLNKKVYFTNEQLTAAGYAPITQHYIKQGMTVKELAQAAISYSDNAAVNLLMNEVGGPGAVTAFARSIGDEKFNLVRMEPNLNSAVPGDERDTSTPKAMARSMQKLLLGNALGAPQRNMLSKWLAENTTGAHRVRAAVPIGWKVGDKTGTGEYGTTNDVAIIWPPGRKPILMAMYYTQANKNAVANDQVIMTGARHVLAYFR